MGFWIVIPALGFTRGKSRLAPALSPAERRAFSRASFARVLKAARRAVGARHTLVVSRSYEPLGLARRTGGVALVERRKGLNESARQGSRFARLRGARGVVVVHSDLPALGARDLAQLMRPLARHRGVVLAPDRARSGTNAVAMRGTSKFHFRFGAESFPRHLSEARRRRVHAWTVCAAGLANDVDTPQDLAFIER